MELPKEQQLPEKQPVIKHGFTTLLCGVLFLIILFLTSLYSYLLFHILAEMFSIVIACGIFMIAWNSRRIMAEGYFLFLGIAYLFIGGTDLLHTLTYKGMGVFPGYESNLATQMWISSRYLESISLLISSFFIGRKLKPEPVFFSYTLIFFLLLCSIFYWKNFPVCFVDGTGLTSFKIVSEYIIIIFLLGSIILLLQRREGLSNYVLGFMVASISVTVFSEIAFTLYSDPYSLPNMIGHFLKVISFYLIYKAIIETGLVRPYDLLFRSLKRSKDRLKESEEKFHSMVESMEDQVYICSPAFRISYMNTAMKNMVGFDATGDLCYKVINGLEEKCPFCVMDNVQKRRYSKTEIVSPKNGRSYEISHSPVFHSDGSISKMTIYRDVTRQKRNRAELIKERDKAQRYLDIAGAVFVLIKADQTIELINKQGCAVLGFDEHEIVGKNWFDHFMPKRIRSEMKNDFSALASGNIQSFKYFVNPVLTKSGEERTIAWYNVILRDDEENFYGILSSGNDITQTLRAEMALKRMNENLEKIIEERTAELRRLSERIVTAHEEERKRIARELHDGISQSLAAIKFRLEDIALHADSETDSSFIRSIEQIISMIQQTVEEVRLVQSNLRPSMLDDLGILATVNWFCKEFESTYVDIRVEKHIAISENQVPDSLKIVIFRMLQEGLNNVVKHSRADIVCVSLTKNNRSITLEIKDNGMGFDTEKHLKPDDPLRGFGISSLRERAIISGGAFSIESRKGEGTELHATWILDPD
ncbi:MASE3 domain-containing protein [Thermodesulfobacteriota bacterium]